MQKLIVTTGLAGHAGHAVIWQAGAAARVGSAAVIVLPMTLGELSLCRTVHVCPTDFVVCWFLMSDGSMPCINMCPECNDHCHTCRACVQFACNYLPLQYVCWSSVLHVDHTPSTTGMAGPEHLRETSAHFCITVNNAGLHHSQQRRWNLAA